MTPNLFKRDGDGIVILEALREAERNPVATPIDLRKLARQPRLFKVGIRQRENDCSQVVSVPSKMMMSQPLPSRSRWSNLPHATRKSSIIC